MTTNAPQCRSHIGFYELGNYFHAKRLKTGTFSLYEGCWASTRCGVGYLEVCRDINGKPRRFATLDAASEWVDTRTGKRRTP